MRVNEGQGLLNANPGLSGESQCMIDHFTYVDGVWNGLTVHMDFIITKAASNVHPIALMNVDTVKKFPRRSVTKCATVFEYVHIIVTSSIAPYRNAIVAAQAYHETKKWSRR